MLLLWCAYDMFILRSYHVHFYVHTTFIPRSYRVHFDTLTTLVAVYIVPALSPSSPTNIYDEFESPLPLASALIRLPCHRLFAPWLYSGQRARSVLVYESYNCFKGIDVRGGLSSWRHAWITIFYRYSNRHVQVNVDMIKSLSKCKGQMQEPKYGSVRIACVRDLNW